MDLDLQQAIVERIKILQGSQDKAFLALESYAERYEYAEKQIKDALERTRGNRSTTARNPDADYKNIMGG